MARFYFHLLTTGAVYHDLDGNECPDVAAAQLHAKTVARELMQNADASRKLWSLRVERDDGRHAFELIFAGC